MTPPGFASSANNAGIGVPSAARHSLPISASSEGPQRPKRPGYRSPPRYNFRRHDVAGHPIAEESSGTTSSHSVKAKPMLSATSDLEARH